LETEAANNELDVENTLENLKDVSNPESEATVQSEAGNQSNETTSSFIISGN